MNADDVANYLRENPAFFETRADLLAEIHVPHPHDGRAISISDRQLLALREKNRALEEKLGELIQFGEENDAISEKMHKLCIVLLAARSLEGALAVLHHNLGEDFAVPHTALRFWGEGPRTAGAESGQVSEQLKGYAAALTRPFCGPSFNAEAASWFGESANHVRSVALMPLARGSCFGLLALGSEDPLRFYPEMGTLYLRRLAELVSAALSRQA